MNDLPPDSVFIRFLSRGKEIVVVRKRKSRLIVIPAPPCGGIDSGRNPRKIPLSSVCRQTGGDDRDRVLLGQSREEEEQQARDRASEKELQGMDHSTIRPRQ